MEGVIVIHGSREAGTKTRELSRFVYTAFGLPRV
jgi:hypothetical protein